MIGDLDAYKEGSEACRNYSGLTMRVRTLAVVVAAAAIAVPFTGNLPNDKTKLAWEFGGIILAAVAISFWLVDWHYQSAFAAIRDSLAMLEAQHGVEGPWRAHLRTRTRLWDHIASYVPFLLLGLIAALALDYTYTGLTEKSFVGRLVTWTFFALGVGVFLFFAGAAWKSDKQVQEKISTLMESKNKEVREGANTR